MNFTTRTILGLVAAASLPVLAQEPRSGFYVGGTLGSAKSESTGSVALSGGWSSETVALQQEVTRNWSKNLEKQGSLVGLQGGYRFALGSGWVLDTGAKVDFLSTKKELATGPVATTPFPTLTYDFTTSVEIKQAFSLEAKTGYQFGAHMPFITLGYVMAKAEVKDQIISNGGYKKLASESKNMGAFQWGVGYEFHFNQQWAVNATYTSADLGDLRTDTAFLPGSSFPGYGETFTHKLKLTEIRLGVNFQF